jgi:hypothetical protein
MTNKTSSINVIASDTQLIAGIQKHKTDLPASISLVGQEVTPDQAVTILQARIATANAVPPAKAAYAKAVAAHTAEMQETDELVRDLRAYLVLTNKKSPDVLADYGLTIKKAAKPSVATKVVAVEKRTQTRTLRGTTGPKAKKTMKAALTGPVVVDAGGTVQAAPALAPHAASSAAPEGTPSK